VGNTNWQVVYQSRSGPPSQPWLEPDVGDVLRDLHAKGKTDVVIAPIGFLSDHMEVIYDLDTEARALCDRLGINMVRAATVGGTSRFVTMVCNLIEERTGLRADRSARGNLGPCPDVCQEGCCPSGRPVAFGESQPT
jgi:ferrochelatase